MPSIAFDVVLILTVYHATQTCAIAETAARGQRAHPELRPRNPQAAAEESRLPLVAAGVITFQPAVLYDSAVWAQTDSAITSAMLGAIVLAYAARPALSGAAYALGLAVKPHPVIIGPLLLLALLRHGGVRAAFIAGAAVLAVAAVVLGPWIVARRPRADHRRLSDVVHQGPQPALRAGVEPLVADRLGGRSEAEVRYLRRAAIPHVPGAGLSLSIAAAGLALAYAMARPGLQNALIAAAYQAFAFYALPVSSHERYLYPLLALLLPVAMVDRRWLWLYVPLSATFFLNLFIVAPPLSSWMDRWVYGSVGVVVSFVHVGLFAVFTTVMAYGLVERIRERAASSSIPLPPSTPAAEPASARQPMTRL